MLDMISIYIGMKYMELICLQYMFAWKLTSSTTDENGSCSVHHTCNMRICSDISIANAQGHPHIRCVCMYGHPSSVLMNG